MRPSIEDAYSSDSVEEFLSDPRPFSKHPGYHYSQLLVKFDASRIRHLFEKLGLPTSNITVLVFGGFAGEFARSLRSLGLEVVFTDPMEIWVRKAAESGLEAYKHFVEDIPAKLLARVEYAASFECYHALPPNIPNYHLLRLLALKHGIVFAESEATIAALREKEQATMPRLKSIFLPLAKVYPSMGLVMRAMRILRSSISVAGKKIGH